ncbi:hypothetical protein ACVBAX_22510 [Robertmurraya sp. GLU-23]
MKNLIRLLIERISQYSISSFFFWIYMIKGGVIYGFVPSAIGLVNSLHDDYEDQSIQSVFRMSYDQHHQYKGLSFFLFLFSGLTVMSIYQPLHSLFPFLGLIQIPLLVWTAVLWIFFIYTVYFLATDKNQAHPRKWLYALAFDTCIRHPLRSLVIFITLIAFSLIVKINLIAFIFLAPPLFIILTRKIVYIPDLIRN